MALHRVTQVLAQRAVEVETQQLALRAMVVVVETAASWVWHRTPEQRRLAPLETVVMAVMAQAVEQAVPVVTQVARTEMVATAEMQVTAEMVELAESQDLTMS